MTQSFDFEQALKALQSGQDLTGKDGLLTPLIKQLTEAALKAELEQHLSQEQEPNRKNGTTSKTVKTAAGAFELETPRDRAGTFEPKLVKKNQTVLTNEIDRKILSMYALGVSYRDIRAHVEEMYGIDVSEAVISGVTDKLIPELKEWQQRPLEEVYPFVWLDAIHYKVKDNGRYVSKAIYTILGLNVEGKKELLGLYLSETEGANYWLTVLTDLHNRGVKDILIACVDGLTGFPEAIGTIYPDTEVQQCIIHQIRNSMKYVASKHQKEFMVDLKPVYRAMTKAAAETELDALEAKWGNQYPIVIQSWRRKWENLSVYFKYPEYVRKAIYTTNAIEAVHRQFRKLTRTKGAFPNENSLLKLLYAGILTASKKWTMPIQNWSVTLSQLAIHYSKVKGCNLDIKKLTMTNQSCACCESVQLTRFELDNQSALTCVKCQGIWLDNYNDDIKFVCSDEDLTDAKESHRICPEDGTQLKHGKIAYLDNLEVDACEHCGGVWLDHDEYQHFKHFETVKDAVIEIDKERTWGHWLLQLLTSLPTEFNVKPKTTPKVTFSLIAICFAVFILELALADGANEFITQFGFSTQSDIIPIALFTHQFLHGSWLHLLGNMYFLYLVGDNLEDVLGRKQFLLTYLSFGVFSGVAQFVVTPDSPLIGASGAIAGLMGYYLVVFREAKLTVMLAIFQFKLPAIVFFVIWLVINILGAAYANTNVAYLAHIGGFVAGVAWGFNQYKKILKEQTWLYYLNNRTSNK